jgi:hypothetical protein
MVETAPESGGQRHPFQSCLLLPEGEASSMGICYA